MILGDVSPDKGNFQSFIVYPFNFIDLIYTHTFELTPSQTGHKSITMMHTNPIAIESYASWTKKKDLVAYLQRTGLKSSFPRKQDLLRYLADIQWSLDFPWRHEQSVVIDCFEKISKELTEQKCPKKIIAVQGLFGCGKTTMLLGMLNMGFWRGLFTMNEICFCAFNVCIKEEIRKKIQSWGIKNKAVVRTFDSLIYEFCKFYEYPHLKLPNYKGKRLFVYNKCREENKAVYSGYHHIKYLFVDESQDLEKTSLQVFQTFFPNACIIFVGDIFQSVQKEPRESLLWHVSHHMPEEVHYFYMRDTPRVPKKVLCSIQEALCKSYPEYSTQIRHWKSSNETHNTEITWIPFKNYSELYEKLFEFLETHPLEKSMVLTFSSCITVRGTLGDLARVRRAIQQKGYAVNTNYKNMDKKCLFLSTANSSKGLERDFVFIMSTFPLEKAFINFSNDLTTNLITVAVSRAKQKVFVCVPTDKGRFSQALYDYKDCPVPTFHYENQKSSMNILSQDMSKQDYIDLEHNVTELLRQNILQFDTRVLFKSFVKKTMSSDIIQGSDVPVIPKSCLQSEEERSFVGVCIEVLMTSCWTNKYPAAPSLSELAQNPYYHHVIGKIADLRKLYIKFKNMHAQSLSNSFEYFKTLFLYTELHIAIHHKMFFFFSVTQRQDLFRYWKAYRGYVYHIRPDSNLVFKPQTNVKMPLLTGIADGVLNDKQKCVYEIKASVKNDWKEDAFVQAFCYAIMLGQSWFTIKLVNLFKNSQVQYVVYLDNVRKVRQMLLYDILVWNFSSYMAKNYHSQKSSSHSDIEEYIFLNIDWNVLEDFPSEIVAIRMLSPTRFHIDLLTDSVADLKYYLSTYTFSKYIFCGDPMFQSLCSSTPEVVHIMDAFPEIRHANNMNDCQVPADNHINVPQVGRDVDSNLKESSRLESGNIVLQTMQYICNILIPAQS